MELLEELEELLELDDDELLEDELLLLEDELLEDPQFCPPLNATRAKE